MYKNEKNNLLVKVYNKNNNFDIRKYLKNKSKTSDNRITREELSERIGISWPSLQKLLNKSRPISRDCVIAICIQLKLNVKEANKALLYYDKPLLFSGFSSDYKDGDAINDRDDLFISILDDGECISLDEINERLSNQGLSHLNINGNKKKMKEYSPYTIIDKNITVNIEDAFFNRYDSLDTQYDIKEYTCVSSMLIENKETQERKVLKYDNYGNATIYDYKKYPIVSLEEEYKHFEDIKKYSDCFQELQKITKREIHRIYTQLDDTRNYKERKSAKYMDGQIHIFIERFNYFIPELNEYFFVEYYDGKYFLSISEKSQFLYYKLGKEKYLKEFRRYKGNIIIESSSLEALKNEYLKRFDRNMYKYAERYFIQEFSEMVKKIDLLICELKKNTVYIRNTKYIFDGPNADYEICKYFGVEKQFGFQIDETSDNPYEDEYVSKYQTIEVDFEKDRIILKIEDFLDGFELGLNNFEDVCIVKRKYGTVRAILENL